MEPIGIVAVAIGTALSAALLGTTGGDLPSWLIGAGITPTTLAFLFLTGMVKRGKDFDALESRHAVEMTGCSTREDAERKARERAEEREREMTRAALPALQAATQSMDRMAAFMQGKAM